MKRTMSGLDKRNLKRESTVNTHRPVDVLSIRLPAAELLDRETGFTTSQAYF